MQGSIDVRELAHLQASGKAFDMGIARTVRDNPEEVGHGF